ncbi:MAG: tryptophan synthase subunit alpha [Candidatus Bathyarchaeia archaeon]|nr:tryptophan synthase subunit alpha [Candidatus Bathyarchaeota archaeon]
MAMVSLSGAFRKRVLMVYLTAGDPYVDSWVIETLSEHGVDIFEFGIPTARPKYDGLTIKASYRRAIESGVTLEKSFQFIEGFRLRHKVVLTYFEYARSIGLERLMSYALNAGAEGVLLPDLLIDYSEDADVYVRLCKQYGFEPIFFITSSFPYKLISEVARLNPAFIYMGLMASTGTLLPITISRNISIIKSLINNTPLLTGFAISEPKQVLECIRAGADGVVIGSAIIRLISGGGEKQHIKEELRNYISSIKEALEAPV